MRPLRFGIIGCGQIVQDLHLPAWASVPEARLVSICDVSPQALARVAGPVPAVRRYTDVEVFLQESGDMDFVVLATPATSHGSVGEAILRRKLHLLCEKPLALSADEAEQMYRAAEEEGMLVCPI